MLQSVIGCFSNSIFRSNYRELPSVAGRALKTILFSKLLSEKQDRFKYEDEAEHINFRMKNLFTTVLAFQQNILNVF